MLGPSCRGLTDFAGWPARATPCRERSHPLGRGDGARGARTKLPLPVRSSDFLDFPASCPVPGTRRAPCNAILIKVSGTRRSSPDGSAARDSPEQPSLDRPAFWGLPVLRKWPDGRQRWLGQTGRAVDFPCSTVVDTEFVPRHTHTRVEHSVTE